MRTDNFVKLQDTVYEKIDSIKKVREEGSKLTGVPTGFKDYDSRTGGLQGGEVFVVGARPGMGKTAFALSVARNLAIKEKRPVAYFSLEMSKEQLTNRVLVMETNVDSTKIKTGNMSDDDWMDLISSADEISTSNLYIDDTAGITVDEICRRSTELKEESGVDLIIIDYLQLIGNSGRCESRQQELAEISRKLKELSKTLNVPVMILSQLSSAIALRENHQPMVADFREAGIIEQGADTVIFLHRDEYYNRDSEYRGVVQITFAKHRNDNCGILFLRWDSEHAVFSDFIAEHPLEKVQLDPYEIISTVCRYINVDERDVVSKKREDKLKTARQLIMYLCRSHTDLSLIEIGAVFGSRDHTTVMSGISAVKHRIESDNAYSRMVSILERELLKKTVCEMQCH